MSSNEDPQPTSEPVPCYNCESLLKAEVAIIAWLRGAGYLDAANALAEMHGDNRALRGLKPLIYVETLSDRT